MVQDVAILLLFNMLPPPPPFVSFIFIGLSRDGPYYVIGYGGRPHRFPHDNFSSVYWIFTKLGHIDSPVEGEEPYLFWGH